LRPLAVGLAPGGLRARFGPFAPAPSLARLALANRLYCASTVSAATAREGGPRTAAAGLEAPAAPTRADLLWGTLRPLERPGRARTVGHAEARRQLQQAVAEVRQGEPAVAWGPATPPPQK
jgi:hypothetical protein